MLILLLRVGRVHTGADKNMRTALEDYSCKVDAKGYYGYSHRTIAKLSLRASE